MVRSSPASLGFLVLCVMGAAASVYGIPQTPGWNVVRFGLGVVCLAPFAYCFNALRTGRPVTGRRAPRPQPRRARYV